VFQWHPFHVDVEVLLSFLNLQNPNSHYVWLLNLKIACRFEEFIFPLGLRMYQFLGYIGHWRSLQWVHYLVSLIFYFCIWACIFDFLCFSWVFFLNPPFCCQIFSVSFVFKVIFTWAGNHLNFPDNCQVQQLSLEFLIFF